MKNVEIGTFDLHGCKDFVCSVIDLCENFDSINTHVMMRAVGHNVPVTKKQFHQIGLEFMLRFEGNPRNGSINLSNAKITIIKELVINITVFVPVPVSSWVYLLAREALFSITIPKIYDIVGSTNCVFELVVVCGTLSTPQQHSGNDGEKTFQRLGHYKEI